MGWREREWAKFTDDEWKRIVGPRMSDPTRTTTTLGSARAGSTPSAVTVGRPYRATAVTLVAALVTLLATTLGLLVHLRTRLHVPTRAPASGNVLDVHWRSSDLAPAAAPGQICLAAPTAGRVCAAFAAGQRPADALSTALKARGVSVRSS